MGHRFTYVVSPEEERENLTVEWFLRRHGYSRHIITGLKRTEDGIFRNGVRAWTSQAVHAGDVIETHLVETDPSDGILPRPVQQRQFPLQKPDPFRAQPRRRYPV